MQQRRGKDSGGDPPTTSDVESGPVAGPASVEGARIAPDEACANQEIPAKSFLELSLLGAPVVVLPWPWPSTGSVVGEAGVRNTARVTGFWR